MSVLSSMFLRAYRICSPTFLDAEISTLYKIFEELKYPKHVIDKAHNKARRNFYSLSNNNDEFNSQRKRIVCLPYASAFENFNHILKDSDLKVVHKFPNTLGKMLVKKVQFVVKIRESIRFHARIVINYILVKQGDHLTSD